MKKTRCRNEKLVITYLDIVRPSRKKEEMHKSAQMSCASEFFALSSNLFAEFPASIFIRSIKSEHIIASSQFYIFRNMRKSRCRYKQTCEHLFEIALGSTYSIYLQIF